MQEERTIIQELRHEHNYQLQELLYYSFLAKSTYEYYPRSRRKGYSDLALLSLIKVIKGHNPSFGYLPMTDTLKIKYGLKVNHKRAYRNTTCVQASMIHPRVLRARRSRIAATKSLRRIGLIKR